MAPSSSPSTNQPSSVSSSSVLTSAVPTAAPSFASSGARLSTGYVCTPGNAAGYVTWSVSGNVRTAVTTTGWPRFAVYDYCPFGYGGLYCGSYVWCPSGVYGTNATANVSCMPSNYGAAFNSTGSQWGSVAADATSSGVCPNGWSSLKCPQQSGSSASKYDCPVSAGKTWTMPANPVPASQSTGPAAAAGSNIGVGLDGVPLFDSYEASGQTLDTAHIVQDQCNGHVTPGMAGATYHYHRAPVCAITTSTSDTPYTDVAGTHSPQLAYANDGACRVCLLACLLDCSRPVMCCAVRMMCCVCRLRNLWLPRFGLDPGSRCVVLCFGLVDCATGCWC